MERLYLLESDPNAAKLAAIAELLGAPYEQVREMPARPGCLILRERDYEAMRPQIEGSPHAVLVYEAGSSEQLAAQLKPAPRTARKFEIGRTRPEVTAVLSGLEVETRATCAVFERPEGFETLITADGAPFFVTKDRLFVLGARDVVDLNRSAERGCEPARDHFAELLPFAMFIKWALGDRCWRAAEACASIVIDDPLLRPRYGCIEFESFLEWLRADNLAATFAFIPWNHKRSDPRTVTLFRDNPEKLSICVHGCDHTKGEFSIADPARLDALSQTALARMQKHKERFGLQHDRVMVFPQGKFSMEALASLHRSGYLAAVNTTSFPTDYAGEFTLRDLLDVAITRPGAAPLFRRRYPVDLFAFATDLFFERPAIIVQHHQDFREGFAELSSFTRILAQAQPQLRWKPIGSLVSNQHWTRRLSDGTLTARSSIRGTPPKGAYSESSLQLIDRARIAARRHLSEFRDNYVHPSEALTSALAALRR